MKSYCFALAALAAIGFAGAAFAGEAIHPGKAKGPVAMSDSQLDKVTAGRDLRVGIETARESPGRANPSFPSASKKTAVPGHGISTTCASIHC
jgi:hypothetical protein